MSGATAFQSNGFQTSPLAFQITVSGGGGVVGDSGISGGYFSKKKWHALVETMAAEKAAREQAEFLKTSKKKHAARLAAAAEAARRLIEEAERREAEEEQRELDAHLTRVTELLEAATKASRTTAAIKNAERVMEHVRAVLDHQDEEEAIALLLLHY